MRRKLTMTNSDIQRLIDEDELACLLARPERVTTARIRGVSPSDLADMALLERGVAREPALHDFLMGDVAEPQLRAGAY
jgi:hypothetical protein